MNLFTALQGAAYSGQCKSNRKFLLLASCLISLFDCDVLELYAASLGDVFNAQKVALGDQIL